jgi:hypothetical protein
MQKFEPRRNEGRYAIHFLRGLTCVFAKPHLPENHLLAQGIPFNAKLAGTSLVPLNPA